jgi:hypothetical protein
VTARLDPSLWRDAPSSREPAVRLDVDEDLATLAHYMRIDETAARERFDSSDPPLIITAYIARVGELRYGGGRDGADHHIEHRDEADLFSLGTLNSIRGIPLTRGPIDHHGGICRNGDPRTVGRVLDARRHGDFVHATIAVLDAATKAGIRDGSLVEFSGGYKGGSAVVRADGVREQRDLRWGHVSILGPGGARGGRSLRVLSVRTAARPACLDAADDASLIERYRRGDCLCACDSRRVEGVLVAGTDCTCERVAGVRPDGRAILRPCTPPTKENKTMTKTMRTDSFTTVAGVRALLAGGDYDAEDLDDADSYVENMPDGPTKASLSAAIDAAREDLDDGDDEGENMDAVRLRLDARRGAMTADAEVAKVRARLDQRHAVAPMADDAVARARRARDRAALAIGRPRARVHLDAIDAAAVEDFLALLGADATDEDLDGLDELVASLRAGSVDAAREALGTAAVGEPATDGDLTAISEVVRKKRLQLEAGDDVRTDAVRVGDVDLARARRDRAAAFDKRLQLEPAAALARALETQRRVTSGAAGASPTRLDANAADAVTRARAARDKAARDAWKMQDPPPPKTAA